VNYVDWGADDFDVIYPDGNMSNYDNTTWVADSLYDACFEIYITGGSQGNDGYAIYDFASKNMMLGVFGTSLYKMDKNSAGTPDGEWDVVPGGSSWDSFTKLVSNFDGVDAATAFTDPIAGAYTFGGTAELDTAEKKFGTASLLLDGDSDYVTLPDSEDWNFGSGDFTIDGQIRTVGLGAIQVIVAQYVDDTHVWALGINTDGALMLDSTDGAVSIQNYPVGVLSINTTYHIALVRSGNTFKFFVNGVQQGATVTNSDAMANLASLLYVGQSGNAGSRRWFNGYIDELRISKGVARWTADFTPPTAAYTADALALTSSRHWTFSDWQSGRALINSDIGLYSYIGTGDAAVVSAAPVGKFCAIFKNYVFIAGIRGSPNVSRYSALSDYTTYPAANSLNFDTNDGDIITGMRILRGKLYIFKRYSIHRVSYLGSNPTFQVDQILGIGTPAHYTIKEIDLGGDIGTVLVFLTTEKRLVIFDGYNVQIIHDRLAEESNDLFGTTDDQPLSFADMNLVYSDLFHATVKADSSEYILYCVLGDDTTINYAFVFDYKVGGIFPYDSQPFASSSYVLSTNKTKILYCVGYEGYMLEMESGDSDDGSAINAYWVSGKIRPELVSLMMKALQLALNFKQVSSASELLAYFQFRIDWNVSWTTAEPFPYNRSNSLTFGETVSFEIGTVENMLQIKIYENSTNPALTLYNIDLYGPVLGLSVGDAAVS